MTVIVGSPTARVPLRLRQTSPCCAVPTVACTFQPPKGRLVRVAPTAAQRIVTRTVTTIERTDVLGIDG